MQSLGYESKNDTWPHPCLAVAAYALFEFVTVITFCSVHKPPSQLCKLGRNGSEIRYAFPADPPNAFCNGQDLHHAC